MAAKKGHIGEPALNLPRRLLDAGTAMFAARGFHATTTREIASAAGVSSAAMYVHYASKEELLHEIIALAQHEVLNRLNAVVESTTDAEADERLGRLVETFARYHVENHDLARVGHFEMQHLSADRFVDVEQHRHAIDSIFREAVSNAAPDLAPSEVAMTALALQSMCIDIARWYADRGAKLRDRVPQFYARLAAAVVHRSTAPGMLTEVPTG